VPPASRDENVGRRCEMGCETWPDDTLYSICPNCEEPTRRFTRMSPLSAEEALSKKKHADFERWCEANDRT
jgi:hypothetical protein